MMTRQEIFDKVVDRLFDGTGQAIKNLACSYFDDRGRKCAVGIFIPDGHPAQKYVGNVEELLRTYPDLPDPLIFDNFALLQSLQRVHDQCPNWNGNDFYNADILREIARDYRLNTKKLDAYT